MKVIATSDLHGALPQNIPECDLLVIAGDISPVYGPHIPEEQAHWFEHKFIKWMKTVNAGMIILIAGNHDFFPRTDRGVQALKLAEELDERFFYLEDVGIAYGDPREKLYEIYGTPWTHKIVSWAFQAADGPKPEKYHNNFTGKDGILPSANDIFDKIPGNLDILVSHGPPRGYGDKVTRSHVGSKMLLEAVEEKKPKILICGHIHEGYGSYKCHDTYVYCVSHMNRNYEPVNRPVEIDL